MDNIINKCNNCEPAWLCEDCFQKNQTMNKEELEKEISILKERVEANKTMSEGYVNDLAKLQKQLEDVNKPEITPMMIDEIHSAVEKAVEGFDFENTGNYEFEFGMDYDGKVHVESVGLQCAYELTDQIVTKVCNLFKEADCPTDEENERDNKEAEQVADQLNKE